MSEYLTHSGYRLISQFDLIVFDPKGRAGLELGVYATPETFLVSQQGVILHRHIGELTQKIWVQDFLPHIQIKE